MVTAAKESQVFRPLLRQGEHVVCCGPTGSGKTFLAEKFLRTVGHAVVLDAKDELKWKGFSKTHKLQDVAEIKREHLIYAPPKETYWAGTYELFKTVYEMHGWRVCVDEVYSLGTTIQQVPSTYIDCLTRGRSRGVTVWTCTQRPRWLPLFAFTESKHFFFFQVDSETDLKVIADHTNREVARAVEKLSGHEFVYYNKMERKPHISRPIRG